LRCFLTVFTEIPWLCKPSFISCPGGWSQTIPQVKKLDVEDQGLRDYTWSAVVRPVGDTVKFSKKTLEVMV
jgi:hypothetical protein